MSPLKRLVSCLSRLTAFAVGAGLSERKSRPTASVALILEGLEHRTLLASVSIALPPGGSAPAVSVVRSTAVSASSSRPVTITRRPPRSTPPPKTIRPPGRPRRLALFAVAAPAELPSAAAVAPPTPTVSRVDPVISAPSAPSAAKVIDSVSTSAGADPSVSPTDTSPVTAPSSSPLRPSSIDEPARAAAGTRVPPPAAPSAALLDLLFLEIWDQDQMLFPESLPSIDETIFPDVAPSPDDMPAPGTIPDRRDASPASAGLTLMQIMMWAEEGIWVACSEPRDEHGEETHPALR